MTDELIAKIKSDDPDVRTKAWLGAGEVGAPALKPLAAVVTDGELEVSRAAKRAMWRIVRHAGRPQASGEAAAVSAALIGLLAEDQPAAIQREVMWMLSEIAGDEAVAPLAARLADEDLYEDARMVLQRIPGEKSLAALKVGLGTVPAECRINIAQSLRARGVEVPGLPCQKLVPTKKTSVRPVGRVAASDT